jgi:Protein of unknown function (DUF4038)/Putative collagen-binding domain of a collagenase
MQFTAGAILPPSATPISFLEPGDSLPDVAHVLRSHPLKVGLASEARSTGDTFGEGGSEATLPKVESSRNEIRRYDDRSAFGFDFRKTASIFVAISDPQATRKTIVMKPLLFSLCLSLAVLTVAPMPGKLSAENLQPVSTVVFPIKVASGGRHLTDKNGVPFLLWCDTTWNLFTAVPLTGAVSATTYFADRSKRGFNAVYCPLFSGLGATAVANQNFSTYDGILPFNGYISGNGSTTGDGAANNYDITKPNSAYFARIVDMVNLAATYHLAVILNVYETVGWEYNFSHTDTGKVRALGEYIARQFSSCSNIIWNYGNDYQDWRQNSASESAMAALIDGVESVEPRRLQLGCEMNFTNSTTFDDRNWTSLSANCVYTYFPTYSGAFHAYKQSRKPAYLIECNYEEEYYGSTNYVDDGGPAPSGTQGTEGSAVVRHQIFWGLTCGAMTGFNNGLWWTADNMSTTSGWQSQLSAPAQDSGCALVGLLQARRWWRLSPDTSHTFCTAGYGKAFGFPGLVVGDVTPLAYGSVLADTYCTASVASDGSFGIVYIPRTSTITIDLRALRGKITARWMDPVSGVLTEINGSPFANTGKQDFTSPGVNSDGIYTDWVLLLDGDDGRD